MLILFILYLTSMQFSTKDSERDEKEVKMERLKLSSHSQISVTPAKIISVFSDHA